MTRAPLPAPTAPAHPAPGRTTGHPAHGHLTPAHWAEATRLLLAKALAEFTHERLLAPTALGAGAYEVTSDDGRTAHRFRARLRALDHWAVDAASITRIRTADGAEEPLSALDFITGLRGALGLADDILPVYLEEISSTLASTCFKLSRPDLPAAELAAAGFQTIESGMTEGHPCFVANNGRLGFGSSDYLAYAPETAAGVRLLWVAAHRDRTTFTAGAGLSYEELLGAELGAATLERFAGQLRAQGLDPDAYLLIPVHPWQWENKLAVTFAAEVATRRLVLLGEGEDTYRAQQSVRTFFNTSHPGKHYVKTALSVLNMGFMRGLSAAYMEATPAINDWLADLVASDPTLRATGLRIIRERAAIGYRHLEYEAATDRHSPYRKMLAALWRESPVPGLAPGERLATMASLLHTDRAGDSFAAALVTRSGLDAAAWLRGYLDAYLTPLLHCFYAHDLVFMPHGENVVLVLGEDGTVRRAIFKDIAEEIAVLDPEADLPPEVSRIRVFVPDDQKLLSLFTDVFDCFLRFLADRLVTAGLLDEDAFWAEVRSCARAYQAAHPALADRFRRHDLFAPQFALSCLNRLQLRNNRQMVDLSDPSGALQLVGTLKNPIA